MILDEMAKFGWTQKEAAEVLLNTEVRLGEKLSTPGRSS